MHPLAILGLLASGPTGYLLYVLWRKYCRSVCDACRLDQMEGGSAHPVVPHACPFASVRRAIWREVRGVEEHTDVAFGVPERRTINPLVTTGEKRSHDEIRRERERILHRSKQRRADARRAVRGSAQKGEEGGKSQKLYEWCEEHQAICKEVGREVCEGKLRIFYDEKGEEVGWQDSQGHGAIRSKGFNEEVGRFLRGKAFRQKFREEDGSQGLPSGREVGLSQAPAQRKADADVVVLPDAHPDQAGRKGADSLPAELEVENLEEGFGVGTARKGKDRNVRKVQ